MFGRRLVAPEDAQRLDLAFDALTDRIGQPRAPLLSPDSLPSLRGDSAADARAIFGLLAVQIGITTAVKLVAKPAAETMPEGAPDLRQPVISYDPALLAHPVAFAAHLGFELADLLLAPFRPGGDISALTTLAMYHRGLGVIELAGAEEIGWEGFMPTDQRLYALSLYLVSTGQGVERVARHLERSHVRKLDKLFRSLPAF